MDNKQKKKLSPFHLVLMSTGGMIGTGWLFSPYYAFEGAGIWAILSWAIAATLILFVALTFAEVVTFLPIKGGFMRYFDITHSKGFGFIIIMLAWLSYVVYLPIEAQGATQYISFWFPALVHNDAGRVTLSLYGLILAFIIMLSLTIFNTSHVKKVAKANVAVSIFKIILPISLALFIIIVYGKFENVVSNYNKVPFNMSNILFVITSTGMAFAFSGFQNGLILASETKRPHIAIPISVIAPVLVGLCMYVLLTMIYVFTMSGQHSAVLTAVAPLLGILSMLGLNYLLLLMFLDAVISPLGTANVFTAVTSRILQTIGLVFAWKKIQKFNKNNVPIVALWINFAIGLLFLLPMPTWSELVNFLSSLLMLTCMSGPVSLMIFRLNKPNAERLFKLKAYKMFAYLGFIGCTLFIYWSGLYNLLGLFALAVFLLIVYQITMSKGHGKAKVDSILFVLYLLSLTLVSYLASIEIIPFPYDHAFILVISIVFLNVFVRCRDTKENIDIKTNDILQAEK